MTTKPEWERLADVLEFFWGQYHGPEEPNEMNAAAELRRLGHENEALRAMSFDTKRDIETAALLRKQEELLRQALDAFAFAYNACESDWVQDEKIDPAMNAIRNHLEAK